MKRDSMATILDESIGRLEAAHAEHAMALREELRRMERWYYSALALAGAAVVVMAVMVATR